RSTAQSTLRSMAGKSRALTAARSWEADQAGQRAYARARRAKEGNSSLRMGVGRELETACIDVEAGQLPGPAPELIGALVVPLGAQFVLDLEHELGGGAKDGALHPRPEAGKAIDLSARQPGAGKRGGRLLEAECRTEGFAVFALIAEQGW